MYKRESGQRGQLFFSEIVLERTNLVQMVTIANGKVGTGCNVFFGRLEYTQHSKRSVCILLNKLILAAARSFPFPAF